MVKGLWVFSGVFFFFLSTNDDYKGLNTEM